MSGVVYMRPWRVGHGVSRHEARCAGSERGDGEQGGDDTNCQAAKLAEYLATQVPPRMRMHAKPWFLSQNTWYLRRDHSALQFYS